MSDTLRINGQIIELQADTLIAAHTIGTQTTVTTIIQINSNDIGLFDRLSKLHQSVRFVLETDGNISEFTGTIIRITPDTATKLVQVEIQGGFHKDAIRRFFGTNQSARRIPLHFIENGQDLALGNVEPAQIWPSYPCKFIFTVLMNEVDSGAFNRLQELCRTQQEFRLLLGDQGLLGKVEAIKKQPVLAGIDQCEITFRSIEFTD